MLAPRRVRHVGTSQYYYILFILVIEAITVNNGIFRNVLYRLIIYVLNLHSEVTDAVFLPIGTMSSRHHDDVSGGLISDTLLGGNFGTAGAVAAMLASRSAGTVQNAALFHFLVVEAVAANNGVFGDGFNRGFVIRWAEFSARVPGSRDPLLPVVVAAALGGRVTLAGVTSHGAQLVLGDGGVADRGTARGSHHCGYGVLKMRRKY